MAKKPSKRLGAPMALGFYDKTRPVDAVGCYVILRPTGRRSLPVPMLTVHRCTREHAVQVTRGLGVSMGMAVHAVKVVQPCACCGDYLLGRIVERFDPVRVGLGKL